MMDILNSVKIVSDDSNFDHILLKAYLDISSQVSVSREILYNGNSGVIQIATKNLLGVISRIVFKETINILRKEAHDLNQRSFNCKDYESCMLLRNTATTLLDLADNMERVR